MTKLTHAEREDLPKGDFVFPKTRRYPIEDAAHAAMRWLAPAESLNTQRSGRRSSGSSLRSKSRSSGRMRK